ncbi:MAG: hypothetical protein E7Z92_04560 [Cyanobacteria bacterium SIG31]|nr:hypothetical protein [Cyanobacteria bacterium SIG31]
MENKCSKYEGLFVFSDEETLQKHLEECEECRREHQKMQKVSELLGEVKFHYRLQAKKVRKVKAVCVALCLIFFSTSLGVMTNDTDLVDALMYGETLTAEDLGFPVDSYGLLVVDDEF